jgi:hypothetical protein
VSKLKEGNELKSFVIGGFRIHFWESLTNFKFLLISDNSTDNLQAVLHSIYQKFFIKNVVFNPLSQIEFMELENGNALTKLINNSNFINETDEYLLNLPISK